MKKTYIILFGAALLLGSCTRNPETDEPTPPHASSGLVIKASCTPATRTDIIEGKSTWEVGDRITVVYDGTAYVYTATEAGATTTFASDTGITAYDPSKPLTAYYPVTTVEGTVAVEPQRTITLQGTEQTNTACAPLVGTPLDKNLAEGALHVSFRNIFSVIELRIDAGELDRSGAIGLAVEPASQEDFDGYLTFTGTVDPSTLALTPAPGGTGSKLTLHFPDNADLTRPQTIKFPVGRFISETGLKLTLTTTDGRTYTKNIYKSGIRTYNEKNGIFSARHLAKALYAFASPGGIETADDLIEFAAAVNAGESLAPWQDERGFVVLLNDIDMTGIETWTPIGDAVCPLTGTNALTIESGRPFTGFFDGQGHSIRNFHMVCDNSTPNRAWGFFGALGPGAVVENLVFDASCSLAVKASKGTDCGILAGVVYDATVRNIVNNAPMSFDGSAGNVRMTMGMVGTRLRQQRRRTRPPDQRSRPHVRRRRQYRQRSDGHTRRRHLRVQHQPRQFGQPRNLQRMYQPRRPHDKGRTCFRHRRRSQPLHAPDRLYQLRTQRQRLSQIGIRPPRQHHLHHRTGNQIHQRREPRRSNQPYEGGRRRHSLSGKPQRQRIHRMRELRPCHLRPPRQRLQGNLLRTV